MIPDTFKQDLLARVDLVSLIGQHVQLKKAGARYIGLCPFHDEKTPSFNVIPAKQFYHCFGCGSSGDAVGFVMVNHGMKFPEAIKYLADREGMQLPAKITTTAGIEVVRQRIDAEAVLIGLEPELTIAVIAVSDSIKGRPLSPEDHERFLVCVQRLLHPISFAKGRPLTKHEIQQLTNSKLRPEEERDIKAVLEQQKQKEHA